MESGGLTVFDRMSRSWELVKASWEILKQDKEMLWLPVISTVATIIVSILFFIPLASTGLLEAASDGAELTQSQQITGLVIAFLFYLVMYTIIIFCNAALVGMALMRMRGEDPTLQDGLRIASERIGKIIGWAAISATVGMILQAIRGDNDNFLSQIVAGILGTAWNLITFLVIPVLVVENVGPIEAVKRSGSLLKKTWGEQIMGTFGMGIISMLAMLAAAVVVGLPLWLIASVIGSDIITAIAIGIVVIVVMFVALVFSALNGIFTAALYRYATEGAEAVGNFYDERTIAGAFQHR
jgi:hypothetical protein